MLKAHQQSSPKQKYSQQENWAKSPLLLQRETIFSQKWKISRRHSLLSVTDNFGFAHRLQTQWSIQCRRSRTSEQQRQNHNLSKHCEVSVISILSLKTVFDVFSLPVSCFRCWLLITLIPPLFSVPIDNCAIVLSLKVLSWTSLKQVSIKYL